MFTEYAEYEIAIGPRDGDAYPFSVTAPGGDARGTLRLPTGDAAYQALAARLAALDTDEELLQALGHQLYDALFQGQAKEALVRSQGMLKDGQGLRIKLRIAAAESEVAALPWELLYDPDQGPLALLDTPIVRYLPQPQRVPTLRTDLPLRVLLTAAQTPPAADVARELNEVQSGLAGLGEHVRITVEPHLTTARFQKLLREGFHVWHFVGRGGMSGDGKTGQLLFRGASGVAEAVSAAQLGIMLNRSGVRLIVLDACESGRLALGPLHSIAPALIRAQVPAVVALQFPTPEQAAHAFAGEFYRALSEGFPIDACVTEGRKAVMSVTGLGSADWCTPAVYTRAPDGRLFDLPPRADIAGAIVAPVGERFASVMINSSAGALLYPARPPAIERLAQPPRPPRATRDFRDRADEQQALLPELAPGRGAWLRGPPGAGRSALLRQIANSPAARALPDGVLYINEQIEPSTLDDIAQGLFSRFFASEPAVRIGGAAARTYLAGLRGLFMLDRLPLSGDALAELADLLADSAALITADGSAPDTLLELALGGLPRAEAVALCAAEARLSSAVPRIAAPLDRLCALLGDLPLPLLLAGRLVQKGRASLEQLVAVLDEMADEPEPLARAARLALTGLSESERAALAALARIDGQDAGLDALAAISQVEPANLAPALDRLCDLRLVEGGGDRYAIATLALRRILDRLLDPGTQRQRAAAFFAGAAMLHIGDLAWLEAEFGNLTAAIKIALAAGHPAQAGALAQALHPLLVLRGFWGGWGQLIDWAEQAAQAGADRVLQAWALHERGTRAGLLGDSASAAMNLGQARQLRESLGDQAGAAASEHNLAYLNTLPQSEYAPADPSSGGRRLRAALKYGLAALLLLAIITSWFALAPLFSAAPAPPGPTAPATQTAAVIAIAAPSLTPLPTVTPVPSASAPATAAAIATTSTSPTPATPTATPLPSCRIIAERVNLRAGPGTNYPPLAQSLTSGALLRPVARSPAGSWINVRVAATERAGWVNAAPALVVCNIAVASLPIGAVPPTPRPAPSATPALPTVTETPAPSEIPALPSAEPPAATPLDNTPTVAPAPATATPRPASTATPTEMPVPPTPMETSTATISPSPTPCSTCPPPSATPTITPTACSTCPTPGGNLRPGAGRE
jgi:hypothetical protein